MRLILTLLLLLVCLPALGQNVVYRALDPNVFSSNNFMVSVRSGALLTNPVFYGTSPRFGLGAFPLYDVSSEVGFLQLQADGKFQLSFDGSSLTNVAGSGVTLSQVVALIETNSSTFTFNDGTSIAKSNLVVFVGGDSRTQTNIAAGTYVQWHIQLTNSPAWQGIRALVSITTGGGLGFASVTNGWQQVGLPWYSNNWAPGMVGIFADASGRNDQLNAQQLASGVGIVTNDSAYYIACKSNFYATAIKPLGLRVGSATIDATDGYSGVLPTEATSRGRFNFNRWVLENTNVVDFPLDFWRATPNNWNTNIYYDAIHLTGFGNRLWMTEADEAVRLRRGRILPVGFINEGTNAMVRSMSDGAMGGDVKMGTIVGLSTVGLWDNLWAFKTGGNFVAPDINTAGFFQSSSTTAPSLVAQAATNHDISTPVLSVANAGTANFRVYGDGHFFSTAQGVSPSQISGVLLVNAGDQAHIRLWNTSFKEFRFYSRNDSSFVVRDETAGVDRFIITTAGNIQAPSGFASTISNTAPVTSITVGTGATTFWTNVNAFSVMVAFNGGTLTGVGLSGPNFALASWPAALTGGGIPVRAGHIAAWTNTVGTTVAAWTPFP